MYIRVPCVELRVHYLCAVQTDVHILNFCMREDEDCWGVVHETFYDFVQRLWIQGLELDLDGLVRVRRDRDVARVKANLINLVSVVLVIVYA